jgi:hypothetical protein
MDTSHMYRRQELHGDDWAVMGDVGARRLAPVTWREWKSVGVKYSSCQARVDFVGNWKSGRSYRVYAGFGVRLMFSTNII